MGSIPGRNMIFWSSPQCGDCWWDPPSLITMGTGCFSPEEKQLRHEVVRSLPSSAELKNNHSCTFTHKKGQLYLYLYNSFFRKVNAIDKLQNNCTQSRDSQYTELCKLPVHCFLAVHTINRFSVFFFVILSINTITEKADGT